MTLAERIAARLAAVSTDRYMFGLFGEGRMGSGGFGKLQILGKTKHVTRCQNCGRAGLKHAVVCAVVGEDGHPTNQYYYFGTDCAAKLAGKAEKDVEAEAEHQESSGRPRMKSLKQPKPNEGQMELGLRFAAYLHDLMTERYARAKASKGQMGFDFDALASAPQTPAPAAESRPVVSEPPALPVKGKQMGLFDQHEQPKTSAPAKPTGWDEEKHPRWEAGDKQHHGGQFSPKESKSKGKRQQWYALQYRPHTGGGVPRGEYEHKPHPDFKHGQVAFKRDLTPEEVKGFELLPIREDEDLPELANQVRGLLGSYAKVYSKPENHDALRDRLNSSDVRELVGHVDPDKLFAAVIGADKSEAAKDPWQMSKAEAAKAGHGDAWSSIVGRAVKRGDAVPDAVRAEFDAHVKAYDERVKPKSEESPAPKIGDKLIRFTHKDGTGLLNNSGLDRSKLTDDEEQELVSLMDFGLRQPPHGTNGTFHFTEAGEKRHARMLQLLSKASKTGVVRSESTLQAEPNWVSDDGQIAVQPAVGQPDAAGEGQHQFPTLGYTPKHLGENRYLHGLEALAAGEYDHVRPSEKSRLSAAKGALTRERNKSPLFASQIAEEQETPEDRVARFNDRRDNIRSETIKSELAEWKRADDILDKMPEQDRKKVLAHVNERDYLQSADRLLNFLNKDPLAQIAEREAAKVRVAAAKASTGQPTQEAPKAAEGHEPYEHERYPGKWLVPSKAGVRGFGDTLHSSKDEAIAESHRVAGRLKSQQEATAKAESQEKAEADRKAAFKASGMTPAQAALQGRVQAHLNQQVSAQGNVTTRQALLDKELAEGRKPVVREVADEAARKKAAEQASFMLRKGVPTGNESHPDTIKLRQLQEKAKSATKTEYIMEHSDGRYRPLTKMEHDYAASKYQPKEAEPAATKEPVSNQTSGSEFNDMTPIGKRLLDVTGHMDDEKFGKFIQEAAPLARVNQARLMAQIDYAGLQKAVQFSGQEGLTNQNMPLLWPHDHKTFPQARNEAAMNTTKAGDLLWAPTFSGEPALLQVVSRNGKKQKLKVLRGPDKSMVGQFIDWHADQNNMMFRKATAKEQSELSRQYGEQPPDSHLPVFQKSQPSQPAAPEPQPAQSVPAVSSGLQAPEATSETERHSLVEDAWELNQRVRQLIIDRYGASELMPETAEPPQPKPVQPVKTKGQVDSHPHWDTPEFKNWFGSSHVKTPEGKPMRVFHGTKRPDRVQNFFNPKRATSGPMSFFTDDPEIASSYATSKQDTSLEMPESYSQWFKYKVPGSKREVDLDSAWYHLPAEQRKNALERLPHVNTNEEGVISHQHGQGTVASDWDWYLKREGGGNPLKAARYLWLDSGHLFSDESRFLEVLKHAGIDHTQFRMESPWHEQPGVYPVHLSIQNPLDTSNIPEHVHSALQQAGKRKRGSAGGGVDQWDKRHVSGQDWLQRLAEDRQNGTTHAWTSIPDWVTKTLIAHGYDGIKDSGGKGGGAPHNVWIPFHPHQVKSAIGNRGSYSPQNKRINYSAKSAVERYSIGDGEPETLEQLQANLEKQYPALKVVASERPGEIHLHQIEVAKESRGQGIGRMVMERLKGYAQKAGKPITLHAEPEKGKKGALNKFYQSAGFSKVGRNRDYRLAAGHTHIWRPEPKPPTSEKYGASSIVERYSTAQQHDERHIAIGKRFGIPPEAVKSVLETHPDELASRDHYLPPSSGRDSVVGPTTDYPKHSVGTAKIDAMRHKAGETDDAYVDYLREFNPAELVTSEHEDGISKTEPFRQYAEWAKAGKQAPPISVFSKPGGKMVSTNRRRVLAAQQAGSKSIMGWHGVDNPETGLPLKYGDVKRAFAELAKPATDLFGQPVKPAPKPKAVFDSTKGKQQTLFAGLNAKEGQMNLFADAGVPDELVAKPQKPAQKELFSAVRDALVERYSAQQSPWFLRSSRVLAEKMGQHAPASQVLATLRNNQVSPEELKWTGLEKHLLSKGNQPVSQQELHSLLGQFNVGEKVLGDRGYSDKLRKFIAETGWRQDIDGPLHDYIYKMGTEAHKAKLHDKAEEFLQLGNEAWEKRQAGNEPKYKQYTLPGGQNYREMLLTLPQQEKGIEWWYQNVHRPDAVSDMGGDQSLVPDSFEGYDANAKDDLQEMYQDWQKKQGNASQSGYLSNHWDEPNVLAHVRYQDFIGPDGKKHLHIDEIQSDWHQQGRKQGYSSNREERDDAAEQIKDLLDQQQQHHPGSKQWNAINEQIIPLGVVANGGGPDSVPNAPFKNNWHMLAMKRMMHHAAANGYDRVTWTPGEEHASRYDLQKHLRAIHHDPYDGKIEAIGANGYEKPVLSGHLKDGKFHAGLGGRHKEFHGKDLSDIFGKDIAERITSYQGKAPQTITGEGLKAGGSGMRKFYDQMLPNDTNKLIKKHGGKVGQFDLHLPAVGDSEGYDPGYEPPRSMKVHGFDVTPSMKAEAAGGKGQSMFSVYEDADWRIERYEQAGDRQPKFRIDAGMKAAAQQTPPSTKPPAIFGAIGGMAKKAGNWLQDKADKVAGKIGGAAQRLDQKGQAAMAKVGLADKVAAPAKPKSAGVKAGAPLMFNGDHSINGGQTSIPKGTQGKLVGPHQDPKNVVVDVGGQHHVVPKSLLLHDLRHTDHKSVEKSKQEAQQAQADQQAKVRQMTARQRAEAVPEGADKAKPKSLSIGSHELQVGDLVNHGTPGLHPYGRVLEVSPDGKKIKIEEAARSKGSPGGIATTGRHVWIDGHEKIGDTGAIGTKQFPVLRTPDEYRPIGERKEYKEAFESAKKLGLNDDTAHEMAMQVWDDLQAKNNPKPAAQPQPKQAQPQAKPAGASKPRHHAESLQPGDTLRMLKGTDTGTNLKFVGRSKQPGMVEVEHPTLGRQTFRSRDLGLYVPGKPKAAGPSFTDQMKKGYDRSSPDMHTVKRSEFAGQKHGVLAKDSQGRGFLLYGGKKFALQPNEFDGKKLIGDNAGVKIRERIHREQIQALASKDPSAVPSHVREEYDHHWDKWSGNSAFAKGGGKPAQGPAQVPQEPKRGATLKGMPLNTPVGNAGVGRLTPVEQRSPLEDPSLREQIEERAAIMEHEGGYDSQTAMRLAMRDAARRFKPEQPLPQVSGNEQAARPDSRIKPGQKAANPGRLEGQKAALNRSLMEDAAQVQQPKAIFLGRNRFLNAGQAAPSRIRTGTAKQPAAAPVDEEAAERAAIQAEGNQATPGGQAASPSPIQPVRAASAPPGANPPAAKPQSPNLRSLIRPFQAGRNQATMQFADELQRDLHDYAAAQSRRRQFSGRASRQQPRQAAQLESTLNRIAADHFGGNKDAAHLAALQAMQHVKAYMRGARDGEHRVIPPTKAGMPAEPQQSEAAAATNTGRLGKLPTNPTPRQAENHVNTMVNKHIREFAAMEAARTQQLIDGWKYYREKMGVPSDRRFKGAKDLKQALAQGADSEGGKLKNFDVWADQIYKDFPWKFGDGQGGRDDSAIFEFLADNPPQILRASDKELQQKFWESVHPDYQKHLEMMRMGDAPLEHLELKDNLPDDMRDWRISNLARDRSSDVYSASRALVERFSAAWDLKAGGLDGVKKRQQRSRVTSQRSN